MRIYYHGTSIENARSILKNGFGADTTIWYASYLKYVYMREAVSSEAGEDTYNETIHSAFTTAAICNSQENGVAIFQIEIPESLAGCVEPDDSVEYDENSYQIEAEQLNKFIADGSIKIECRVLGGYRPEFRSFVLAYTNLTQINISDEIKQELNTIIYNFKSYLQFSVFEWIESKYKPWESLKELSSTTETSYFD